MHRNTRILQTVSVPDVTHRTVAAVRHNQTNQQTRHSTDHAKLHRAQRLRRARNLSLAHHTATGEGSQLNLSATLLQLGYQGVTVRIPLH